MPSAVGLVAVVISVILFGSCNLPAKAFPTGDGIGYQWCMCAGVFFVGCIVLFVQCSLGHDASGAGPSCPAFIPLASVGGVVWSVSNIFVVPIVDTVGLGMSMSAWGLAETLTVRE